GAGHQSLRHAGACARSRGARAQARALAGGEPRGHRGLQRPHRARWHAQRLRACFRRMSQFTVYANADPASRKLMPYFLNVQSDLIDTAGSRVVVPLISLERAAPVIDHLMPRLAVGDKDMVMDTAQITGVPQ